MPARSRRIVLQLERAGYEVRYQELMILIPDRVTREALGWFTL